jgi:threonine dehydratase
MRVGEKTFAVVSELVDELVTIDDERIFDAVLWTMSRCKLVVEGAAAAPVAALLAGRVHAEPGSKIVCVLSGGNVDLEQLRGRVLN